MQNGDQGATARDGTGQSREDVQRCTVCGTEDELRVHHLDGRRENTQTENLVWMCRDCDKNVNTESEESATWNDHNVGLPDEISAKIEREFVRLVCVCRRDLGWRPDKTRHYYPLVAVDGVFAIARMSAETFEERLVALGLR